MYIDILQIYCAVFSKIPLNMTQPIRSQLANVFMLSLVLTDRKRTT